MGSGNGKNKVKNDNKSQNNSIPQAQNQKNYNAVQNFKRKIDEEFQSNNSQSESDQKSVSQNEMYNQDFKNQKPNLKRFSISQQIQLSKKEEYRINNSLQIFVNKNNETGLQQRKQTQQINLRQQLQIPKQRQYRNKLQEEEEEEEKQIDFRAAVSEQSYEGDKKSIQNSIQAPKQKVRQMNYFNNLQINGSSLFKSSRKIQTVNNFTEDYSRHQKKLLLQSMKNLQKANENDDNDTSSYQSSAYSKSSPKSKKVSSNSPQQKTSCMNTPLSLKKIQIQKGNGNGNHASFSRDKLKKFSQKTVKDLLEQNIFKIQNSQKENFETEQDQDTTSLNQQINQKQETWIHASISKISSSPASEKFLQESNHSQQQLKGNKQYQQLGSLDSQNQNIVDERNTLATSKILQKSNEVTSQTLKTRQDLDNPITSHASESTFKKHAHLKRDRLNQEIASLQDISQQNEKDFKAFQNDDSQQEQDMLQSKRIIIRPTSQIINSYRNIQSQNSLQEKEIEEDSTELKNMKINQYQNSGEYQEEVEEEEQEEEEYLDDGNDQENENVYNNFIDMQNSQKKRLTKDEGLNIEQNYELQEVEELNDSLLTTYDIGYIDFNNNLKSHENEDQTSNELKTTFKSKKNITYLSNDLQPKVKRVYVRSVLQQMHTFQYYGQKNFKFEMVIGEVQQAAYFQKYLKQKIKHSDIQKNDQSYQSADSDSEQQERIIPNISAFAPKKFRVVGGTMYDQEFQQNNQLRNAVSDMEDSQLFINRKKYVKDLDKLSKFGVSVCSRKGNKEEDIQIQSDYIYYRDRLTSIFGVFDGHGPFGYQISNIAYKLLLTKFLNSLNSFVNPELALRQIYRNLSKDINKIIQQEGIVANQFISGISCTFIVKRKNNLLISHVGDTKAFVFKKNVNLNKKDKILAVQLTEDHTPNNIQERNRIYREHGEVKRSQDFSEKIFVRGRDYPAIHITRSIGDLIAQQIGVISEPYIRHYDIDINDSYLLIGTQSLFDLINTEEIWQVISPFEGNNVLEASKYLQSRVKQLKKQHPQMSEDITFVLQYL
ncbi:protein phosphatase 2c (macronuclear) [Tetrahymena thermophila SB210]|uniref:Protein phosphatase 2c n=1 Tax=Tetrahymena thermophila (strain SB210) TaxID=312017 RepID=I7MJB5_TETTS|nr:protein phosphatase 2c [Tetrahymena thermophila SB210]EAS06125.2 protein phosphatase 2c [Tetrahymena thermophila SB210]|eukprot:XP_001026370.2 protein phosphatase 2c [Tetrahymena thermophila SB210]